MIKSEESVDALMSKIKTDALKTYVIRSVVDDYMNCIEEIINIPCLKQYLSELKHKHLIKDVLNEIILQSKVEFNYEEDEA